MAMSDQSPEDRCYHAALRLLGYRFRSEAELRKRLREKEHEAEAIDTALARLRGEGWIDDARFASVLAESKSRKGIGPKRVGLELRRLGVDDEIAGAAIHGADPETAESDLASLVRKRIRILGRSHGPGWVPGEGRPKEIAGVSVTAGIRVRRRRSGARRRPRRRDAIVADRRLQIAVGIAA